MAQKHLASYLRSHRRKSGLTQLELARLVGYKSEDPIFRHEQGISMPPAPAALAYEAIFRVPVAKLFPGFYHAIEQAIEARLAEIERTLQQRSANDRDANMTARKLKWILGRRMGIGDVNTDSAF